MMDFVQQITAALERSTNVFLQGGQDVLADLQKLDIVKTAINIFNIDLRDPANAHISLTLIVTAVTLTIVTFLYAQFTNTDITPIRDGLNAALGAGSGVVRKEGDPPIPPPTEVISLRIYPIKSCRGMELDATRLHTTGLTLDRNWMFIDKTDRKFLTIRSDPSMTLIDTKLIEENKESFLEVSIHGTDGRVVVPAFPSKKWLEQNTTLSTVEIWEQETDGWEYGPEINKIFCKFFNKDVALIYKGPSPRINAVNGSPELYGKKQNHHFADVVSCLVASEASLKDINKRLEKDGHDALTIERFRPNIIVRGRDEHPWEEDTWKRIRITTSIPAEERLYKLDLDCVARCARCQVPNVNPETAVKHPKQPWDELMSFRRVDQGSVAKWKPCFGMLSIPKNEGVIKVGATLEVLETTNKHLYNTTKFKDL